MIFNKSSTNLNNFFKTNQDLLICLTIMNIKNIILIIFNITNFWEPNLSK